MSKAYKYKRTKRTQYTHTGNEKLLYRVGHIIIVKYYICIALHFHSPYLHAE